MVLGCFAGVALLGAATDASAYVVKKTSRGELVHWESRDVGYTLDASMERSVEGATLATQHAMDSWAGSSVGAPDLHIAAPSADAPTKPGFDQKNGVFYMNSGWAPAGRALAITVLTYDNASGRILDADVIFNGVYKFAVLADNATLEAERAAPGGTHLANTDGIDHGAEAVEADTVYDLHHVIAHELGHSLGMNDEMERRDALMYRYSAPNDASLRAPASDDLDGLAELYSTRLEAHGNGCGNATVAPKKPSHAAANVATLAGLALMAFLMLRARSNKKARVAFVLAAAAAAYGLFPDLSKGNGEARASVLAGGHASATVVDASTTMDSGLMKTTFQLRTDVCRAATCPKLGHGSVWGGTIGNITQEVGGQHAPQAGERVDVSFAKLPNALAPMAQPLAGRGAVVDESVRVLTAASR